MPRLKPFLECFPELKLNIEVAEVLSDFNAKKRDVLLGVSTLGTIDLVRKLIDHTQYLLCASPKYLKKFGTPSSTAELL